jgi:hypothetical protein
MRMLLIVFLGCILLSGCAARLMMAGLTEAEITALATRSAALGRYGMAVRGSQLAVTNESLFFSRLSRVRIEPGPISRNPRLYVIEDGQRDFFGVLKGPQAIELIGINKRIPLPENSALFRVNTNARVRTGPGTEYQIYKFRDVEFLEKDQAVLVLKRVGSWYQVKLGPDEIGYVLATLLLPVSGDEEDIPTELRAACDICDTKGHIYSSVECQFCQKNGMISCKDCSGNGRFICNDCKGSKKYPCKQCNEKGQNSCSACKGKGRTLTLGGFVRCSSCDGRGTLYCYDCDRRGYLWCYTCDRQGYTFCYTCNRSGTIKCTKCEGNKKITQHVQCTKCDGIGFINSANSRPPFESLKIQLFDDFDNNFNLWPVVDRQDITTKLGGGEYILVSNTQQWRSSTITTPLKIDESYIISVSTKHVTGVIDYGYGLCFSFQNVNNFYVFAIAEGNYKLFRFKDGKYEALIPWTKTELLNKGAKSNSIKIEKKGDVCWLFINNQYVNKVFNFKDLGLNAGFYVENYQTISFDNFKISQ